MTTTPEALGSREGQEVLPTGTAFQKVQELYKGLNIEAQPFGDGVEKIVRFNNGSQIKIIPCGYITLVSVIDNERNVSTMCTISSDGESEVRLSLPPKRIIMDGFTAILSNTFSTDSHGTGLLNSSSDYSLRPEAKDEEQVMLAFVDWVGKSIDEGKITEPPYKLENFPVQMKSPRASTPQLT